MTDEQIIKALDCCHSELGNMCSICPLLDPDDDYCEDELHKNALNLINRQKAENEREINQIKSEAIREFAEKLKDKFGIADCIVTVDSNDIDDLVKEMTEVQE